MSIQNPIAVDFGVQTTTDGHLPITAGFDVFDANSSISFSTSSCIRPVIQADTYIHTQNQASNTWSIQHNLNKYPSVTVVDSAGTVVIGGVQYIDENYIICTFSHPFSGTAYLN
jgi:hypothetical protein